MAHVEVFFKVIALMAGVWALAEIRHAMRSYSSPFLLPLFLFLTFQNVVVLVGLVSSYCTANILGTSLFYPAMIISKILGPFAFLGVVGRAAAFVLVVLGFLDIRPTRRLWTWIGGLFAGLCAFSALRALKAGGSRVVPAYEDVNLAIYVAAVIAANAAMIILAVIGHARRDPEKRAMILTLAYPLLAGQVVIWLTGRTSSWLTIVAIGLTIVFLNLYPTLWILRRYFPYCRREALLAENGNALEEVFRRYGITPREQEIAHLILKGKSHKDIQKELFISLNTVKNHVSHIYQKMGISSRWQFLQAVQEIKGKTS